MSLCVSLVYFNDGVCPLDAEIDSSSGIVGGRRVDGCAGSCLNGSEGSLGGRSGVFVGEPDGSVVGLAGSGGGLSSAADILSELN